MNITIIAVGKLKERYWADACSEYLKRLRPYATVTIREVPDKDHNKCGGIAGALEQEADAIYAALPKQSHVILLAIEGKEVTSEGLSTYLDDLALNGKSTVVFIIGGSDGVAEKVKACVHDSLSFGKITLPHNLARVLLLEQLYRAFKISRGEPYHK